MPHAGSQSLTPLPYQPAPLRHQIIAALREAIEIGQLKAGARLIERDLCEQLGVSRTLLREALCELQGEGLLQPSRGRGLIVAGFSENDAENAYRMRADLEALLVEQFIDRAHDDNHAALAVQGRRLIRAYESGTIREIVTAKRAFLACLCAGANNQLAFDTISRLVLRTSGARLRSLTDPRRKRQSMAAIDAIVAAIGERDAPAARQAAVRHVMQASRALRRDRLDNADAPPVLAHAGA